MRSRYAKYVYCNYSHVRICKQPKEEAKSLGTLMISSFKYTQILWIACLKKGTTTSKENRLFNSFIVCVVRQMGTLT